MKAKDVPPFQEALTDLSPFFSIFYDAFEAADAHVKDFLEQLKAPFDPWIHAHLVRHYVKLDLHQHDVDAQDFKPENLAMSGLHFRIGRWVLRMRKSVQGEMPSPGRSKTLDAYYRQRMLPGDFQIMHNLLLLWHATSVGDFKGLSLVFPLAPQVMKWKVEIPHPAKAADKPAIVYQPDLDVGNLDIEPVDGIDESLADEDDDDKAEGQ